MNLSEMRCFIKNHNGIVRVKGFSLDNGKSWYKIPKHLQPIENHNELKRLKVFQAIDGKRFDGNQRNILLRIKNRIKQHYFNNNGQLTFNSEILKIDDELLNETISSEDFFNFSSANVESDRLDSTLQQKKVKLTCNLEQLITEFKKEKVFKMFEINPETFLSKIEAFFSDKCEFDLLVNHFHNFIHIIYHEWFFNSIFYKQKTWNELRESFLEKAIDMEYQLLNCLKLDIPNFLTELKKFEKSTKSDIEAKIRNHPLECYFEFKTKYLIEIFKLSRREANFFCISNMNISNFKMFKDLIYNQDSLDNYIRFVDEHKNLEPYCNILKANNSELDIQKKLDQKNNEIEEKEQELKLLKVKIDDLETKLVASQGDLAMAFQENRTLREKINSLNKANLNNLKSPPLKN